MNIKPQIAKILVMYNYANGMTDVPLLPSMNAETYLALYHGESGSINRFEDIDPFGDSLESRQQLDILEKHYRIQTQQNEQGDVNVQDLNGHFKAAGGCPRHSRMSVIEMCLRTDVKQQEEKQ